MALLVAGRAVCRVQLPHRWRTWSAWVIRPVPVNRACVPKAHPAIGETALGAPTNRLRSIEPDQTARGGGHKKRRRADGRLSVWWVRRGGPWRPAQPIQAEYHGGRRLE